MFRLLLVLASFCACVSGKPEAQHVLPIQQPHTSKLDSSNGEALGSQPPEISNSMGGNVYGTQGKAKDVTNTDDRKEETDFKIDDALQENKKVQEGKPDVSNKDQNIDRAAMAELGQDIKKQQVSLAGAYLGRAVEVAFEAISLTNRQLQGVSDVMIYDNVQFDIGNVYDPVTGQFTVPVDGIYMVHWAVRAQSSWMWFNLVNGGQVISEMGIPNYYSSSYTYVGGISDSRLLSLTTGDVLYVIGCGKDSTGQCAGDAWTHCDNYNCAFGAVLLYPLAG